MTAYLRCPQCSATLRPATLVPAGRKVQCPKCASVFVLRPRQDAYTPPAAAAQSPERWAHEGEGGLGGKGRTLAWALACVGLLVGLVLVVALSQRASEPEVVRTRPTSPAVAQHVPKAEAPLPPPPAFPRPSRTEEVDERFAFDPPVVRRPPEPLPAEPKPQPPAEPKVPPEKVPAEKPPAAKPPPDPPPSPPKEPEPPRTPPPPPPTFDPSDPAQKPVLVLDPGGHSGTVWAALLTPDGRQVVTVSADKTARVWDAGTGDCLRVFRLPVGPGREGALYAGALSPDGKRLAISGDPFGQGAHGFLIYLLSLETGQIERVLKGHRDTVMGLDFSPDGKYLASGSLDLTARLWEADSGRAVKVLQGHRDVVRKVAFAPGGKFLATATKKEVVLWSVPAGKAAAELKLPVGQFLSVAWVDDDTVATGGDDGFIYLWARQGGLRRSHQVLSTDKVQVTALARSPDGKALLYTGIDRLGRAGIFDLEAGRARPFGGHSNTVQNGSLSADGRLAVTTGGNDHETIVWRTADVTEVQKFQGAGRGIYAVGWSPDGKSIAWGNTNFKYAKTDLDALEQTFGVEDLDFGPTLSTPDTPREEAGNAGPDYHRAVRSAEGYSLERKDFFEIAILRNGRRLGAFRSPRASDRIYCFSVLAGNRAIFGTAFGLYLVDLGTGKKVREFRGHNGIVMAVAPAPDGKYFLTGSNDQTLRVWRPDREEPVLSLFVAERDWIAWTPEGYYAASAYGERLMGWQVNHGPEALASFFPAGQFRRSLYFYCVCCLIGRKSLAYNFSRRLEAAQRRKSWSDGSASAWTNCWKTPRSLPA